MKQFIIFEAGYYGSPSPVYTSADELANQWLKEHPGITIIDFKYQANVSLAANEQTSGSDYHQSICILYDTVMTGPH